MPMQLRIVCPERCAFEDQVAYVAIPSTDGEFGILPHHASEICTIESGYVRICKDKMGTETQRFAVFNGYAQVANDEVILLVDDAADMAEINPDAVSARLAGFEDELGKLSENDARRAYLYNEVAWCKLLLNQ